VTDPHIELKEILGYFDMKTTVPLFDNGGRRSGADRRVFSYAIHIPEKRSGYDRRSGSDRRSVRYNKKGKAES